MTEQRVKFGLYLPPFGPLGDSRALVEMACAAERAGWDGFFLWDHIDSDGTWPVADPWTCFGAIAQATERIFFGPMINPLPRRRPWVVARQTATLSQLSGGRLIYGAGLGTDEFGDFSHYGEQTSSAARSEMFGEAMGIVRSMWAGEGGRHDGAHYHVTLPEAEPVKHPIPVWIASSAGGPMAARRAAEADGIFPNPADRELTAEDVSKVVKAVRAAGRPADKPFEVAIRGDASPAWPSGSHVDLRGLADAGMTWWLESMIHFDPLELSMQVAEAGPPSL